MSLLRLPVLLVILQSAAGFHNIPHGFPSDGPSLDEVTANVEALENDLRYLLFNLTDIKTLSALADDKLNLIQDTVSSHGTPQRDTSHAEFFKEKLKDVIHRMDGVQALKQEAQSLTNATSASLTDQNQAFGDLNSTSQTHVSRLEAMMTSVSQTEQEVLDALGVGSSSSSSSSTSQSTENKVTALEQFVNNRMCEYGEGSFDVESGQFVPFKTNFTENPNVSIAVTGFRVHLSTYGHNVQGYLGFNKFVTANDTQGFNLLVLNNSMTNLDLKDVYCSWMACQGLDTTFVH